MTDKDLFALIDHIDRLLSEYLSARKKVATGKVIRGNEMDIEKIIHEGAFPAEDPTTPTRLALLSIGETLGRVGGAELMHQVYDAYEGNHGAEKANSLSARWDSAAGVWYY